jgi:hypothetical protein
VVGQAFDPYSTVLSDDFGFEAALRFRPRMKRASNPFKHTGDHQHEDHEPGAIG